MIRPLARADCAGVMGLLRATESFTQAELDIAAELMDIVVTRPEQRDYLGFVDDVAGRPDGFLIVGPVPATIGTWHLYWIAVHPDRRGSGLAQQLEQHAATHARAHDAYWLLAETSGQASYERPRRFYGKQGYSVLARIPDYYKPGDDLVVFGKRLR